MSTLPDRASLRPSTLAVLALTALATLARLPWLGERVAHFDEGRVGYWTIHFAETGEFHYRAIIHGPLIQHVNRVLFEAFGASDLTLRIAVAIFGGLLPLSALLYRERLREREVVGLAFFLALNPVLLYYSRFLRSTLLVAGLMFVALGLFVRAIDTRRVAYVYAGVVAVALGFGAKENAAVYVLCWLGAGALLVDADMFRPRSHDTGSEWLSAQGDRLRAAARDERLRRYAGHGLALTLLFLLVSLFLYAPRDPGPGVGLWEVFANGRVYALLERTVVDVVYGFGYWFVGPGETPVSTVATRLAQFLGVLAVYAAPLFVLSVVGFAVERYGREHSRPLVMFAGYWGFVSVLGYPLGTDIWGAWITVNAIVPLAIPAAVGLGLLVGLGREALVDEDRVSVGVAAALLLLVVAAPVSGAATGVYTNARADENQLVQYAQPGDDLRPALRAVEAASVGDDGTDVLFYGPDLVAANPQPGEDTVYPACSKMLKTMPLNWYVAMYDATADCARTEGDLRAATEGEDPPVVVARADQRGVVASHLDGDYETWTYSLRTYGSNTTIFVDTER